jgi:hypothetical protein
MSALIVRSVIVTIPNKLSKFRCERCFAIPSTIDLSVRLMHQDFNLLTLMMILQDLGKLVEENSSKSQSISHPLSVCSHRGLRI